ncbi:MAG: MoxR family ATPase [Ruminococcus sp.]|jgi:MoxR-like ATPase|nr:MoxR family ATPase [Ruminococcus sp.]
MSLIKKITDNIERVIFGKKTAVEELIAAFLAGGHVLIEDVPGVGKTKLADALARSVDGRFNRLQLTPDIMPSDIIGFSIIEKETGTMTFKPGAADCNILLADEINRASPKTQSALLEIMEEHQISLDGQTHPLPNPYMVIATENPVETYGTYHLPEAQMDRFAIKMSIGYPDSDSELQILAQNEFNSPEISPVITTAEAVGLIESVKYIKASDSLRSYITEIAAASRQSPAIRLGISPRGSLTLLKISKSFAAINEREFITPDDIKRAAMITLPHRITLSQKGKTAYKNTSEAVENILETVKVPKE